MPKCTAVDGEAFYVICVRGVLDDKWKPWFDNFVILPQENRESLLYGSVIDQAALHGLLAKIRDLCLPLELVIRVGQKQIDALKRGDYSWVEARLQRYDIS